MLTLKSQFIICLVFFSTTYLVQKFFVPVTPKRILLFSKKFDNPKFKHERNPDKLVDACEVIEGGSDLVSSADAVVIEDLFYIPDRASDDQVFIFRSLESPLHSNFARFSKKNCINWTSTYRSESDIYTPYGKFQEQASEDQKDWKSIYKRKDLKGAWFVSNCDASNGRFEFVKELQKFVQVDIFGKCGNSTVCGKEEGEECMRELSSTYLFYLAFENSNCQEYITEKLFDMGLGYDWVPVVLGASLQDYERIAPSNSFIYLNAADAPSVLAEKLTEIYRNGKQFEEFFSWRRQGTIRKSSFLHLLCTQLNGGFKRRYYNDINEWWHGKLECVTQGRGKKCTGVGICDVTEQKYQFVPE